MSNTSSFVATSNANYDRLSESDYFKVAAQENVLLQLETELQSHRLLGIEARVYGWMLDETSNQIRNLNPVSGQFELPTQ